MSSNHHDSIHLGNYEEFFILYMDGELSPEAMAEVDLFLEAHPDLRAELDLLMGTKLPAEDFTFDASFLMADQMKLGAVSEDLLLFVDNELPESARAKVASGIESDPDMAKQYASLLRAKLDPKEVVAYPDKAELYRHTERTLGFRPWMRAAAAVLLIGSLGLYMSRQATTPDADTPTVAVSQPEAVRPGQDATRTPSTTTEVPDNQPALPVPASRNSANLASASTPANATPSNDQTAPVRKDVQDPIAPLPSATGDRSSVMANLSSGDDGVDRMGALQVAHQTVAASEVLIPGAVAASKNIVTISEPVRSTINTGTPVEPEATANKSSAKGKVKGFLRKATTLLEARTGIDATDDDGKLLIGAVAVRLD